MGTFGPMGNSKGNSFCDAISKTLVISIEFLRVIVMTTVSFEYVELCVPSLLCCLTLSEECYRFGFVFTLT